MRHYSDESFDHVFKRSVFSSAIPYIDITPDEIRWRPYANAEKKVNTIDEIIQKHQYVYIFCPQESQRINHANTHEQICEKLNCLALQPSDSIAWLQRMRYNYVVVDIRTLACKLYGMPLPSMQETSLSHDAIRSLLISSKSPRPLCTVVEDSSDSLQPMQPTVSSQTSYAPTIATAVAGVAAIAFVKYNKNDACTLQ
jgi:hypothetical protein